jgi:hypothetical protein
MGRWGNQEWPLTERKPRSPEKIERIMLPPLLRDPCEIEIDITIPRSLIESDGKTVPLRNNRLIQIMDT